MGRLLLTRTTAAGWLALPIGLLTFLAAQRSIDPGVVGYWTGVAARSAEFLPLSAGCAAVCAAVEGSRLRAGRIGQIPVARSTGAILWHALWPAAAGGVLVQAAALLALSAGTWGSPSAFPLALLPTFVAVCVFHGALGLLVGLCLPAVASVPVSLVLSFCILGFPGASSWMPVHYLSGFSLSQCCSIDAALDPRAWTAGLLFNTLAALGLVLVAARRVQPSPWARGRLARRLVPVASASALLVIAVWGGLVVAAGLSGIPQIPREAPPCAGEDPVVCLYPEQRVGAAEDTIGTVVRNLEAAGIDLPNTVEGSLGESAPGVLRLLVSPAMSTAGVVHSMVSSVEGAAAGEQACFPDEATQRAADALDRWMVVVASVGLVDPDTVPSTAAPNADSARLAALPPARQRAWAVAALSGLADCAIAPVPAS